MDSQPLPSTITVVKNYYALAHVEKEDLLDRLGASEKKVLSQEIRRMLDEDDEEEVTETGKEDVSLPTIRVLPITDQLNSLEKTLNAYATTLQRCINNLQARITNFRLNDSVIP